MWINKCGGGGELGIELELDLHCRLFATPYEGLGEWRSAGSIDTDQLGRDAGHDQSSSPLGEMEVDVDVDVDVEMKMEMEEKWK